MPKSSAVFYSKKLLITAVWLLLTGAAYGQWTQTNGPYGGRVYCLRTDGSRLWAGTDSNPFFSDNGGISWQPSDLGAYRKLDVYDFLFSGDTAFCTTESGVFRSFNGGSTWASVSTGLAPYPVVTTIARKGDRLFVGLNTGHIFFSDDFASTWQKSPNNQPFGVNNAGIHSITILGDQVFISRRASGLPSQHGVLVSSDAGLTWQPSDMGLPEGDGFELITHKGRLYAGSSNKGVFESWDAGLTWHPYNDGLTNFGVSGLIAVGDYLVVSTSGGIFRFVNSEWALVASGLRSSFGALAYLNNKLFVGEHGVFVVPGVWGGLWYESSNGIIATSIAELSALPGEGIWTDRGYFQTFDRGEHWLKGNLPVDLRTVSRTPDYVFGTTYSVLLRSPDGGNSWEIVDSLRGHLPNKFIADGPLILGCTNQDSIVFLSHDFGKTWSRVAVFPGNNVNCGAAAVEGSNIYISDFYGPFWVSRDAGQTWDSIPGAPPGMRSMLVEGPEILAGSYDGLFASHDVGLTWEAVQVGKGVQVTGLCRAGKYVFLSTWGYPVAPFFTEGGVFASADGGETWVEFNEGFPNYNQLIVNALAADEEYLYAAFYGEGVWRRRLDQVVSFEAEPDHKAVARLLSFPNPAREAAYLDISPGVHLLILTDAFGRVCRNIFPSAGPYRLERDGLPAGLYFIALRDAEGQVLASGKMVFAD